MIFKPVLSRAIRGSIFSLKIGHDFVIYDGYLVLEYREIYAHVDAAKTPKHGTESCKNREACVTAQRSDS